MEAKRISNPYTRGTDRKVERDIKIPDWYSVPAQIIACFPMEPNVPPRIVVVFEYGTVRKVR